MSVRTRLEHVGDERLYEFTGVVNADASPAHVPILGRTEITVQVMSIDSGSPTIGFEISLNTDDEGSKVWDLTTGVKAPATDIALTTGGQAETVLQSGILGRPIVSTGTGEATVRVKLTPIR